MKIIENGSALQVYANSDIIINDYIPTKYYKISFSKMQGFFLTETNSFTIKEKIYGNHEEKLNKVLKTFKTFERSLGIILSGEKGIGKSLFAKLLSIEMIKNNIPVIICDQYIPGIANFIQTIDQEVLILFDEFDKTFSEKGDIDPQAEMLSLFDGTSNDKKCYCITCNNLRDLNEYLLNRPGRFHYHFRFDYPDNNEIEIYLKDQLQECYYDEIKNVIRFSNTTNLNYDCLRAIAFELNNGYSFKEAIDDLNIINYNYHETNFTVTVAFNDGTNIIRKHYPIDFDNDLNTIWFSYKNRNIFNVSFDTESLKYDYEQNMYYIDDPT